MADETKANTRFQQVEQEVEERSSVFKKQLGLFDLVLTQVVFVVGTIWVGHAAKLGSEQNFFWILAILTFYLPLAAVVIFLNRLMPLEGGLYQWAKLAFNDFVAFMVAWNLWVFAISILAGIGLVVTTNISYAIGPQAAWMKEAKLLITVVSIGLVVAMVLAATRGLGLGKWVHNAGGLLLMVTFAALIGRLSCVVSRHDLGIPPVRHADPTSRRTTSTSAANSRSARSPDLNTSQSSPVKRKHRPKTLHDPS